MEAELKVGDIVDAEVTKITDFGAFVKINDQARGLIHISQVSDDYIKNINEHLKIGDRLKARILKIGPGQKIDLTLKKPGAGRPQKDNTGFKSSDFEEKLKAFLRKSQQNLVDLKKHEERYRR